MNAIGHAVAGPRNETMSSHAANGFIAIAGTAGVTGDGRPGQAKGTQGEGTADIAVGAGNPAAAGAGGGSRYQERGAGAGSMPRRAPAIISSACDAQLA